MEELRIQNNSITLVDQVEDKLLNYFKQNNFCKGDQIPSEKELSVSLGVARSVLREALSRLKMIGMIETRTKRGMVLSEPSLFGSMKRIVDPRILSEDTLFDILGFRIALEIGISNDIFQNITDRDFDELKEIVKIGIVYENNEYSPVSEFSFHTKLYEITKNKTIYEFQDIIHPIMIFIKEHFKEYLAPINVKLASENKIVTHSDLLYYLERKDEAGYKKAIEDHFGVYKIFLQQRNRKK